MRLFSLPGYISHAWPSAYLRTLQSLCSVLGSQHCFFTQNSVYNTILLVFTPILLMPWTQVCAECVCVSINTRVFWVNFSSFCLVDFSCVFYSHSIINYFQISTLVWSKLQILVVTSNIPVLLHQVQPWRRHPSSCHTKPELWHRLPHASLSTLGPYLSSR